MSTSVFKRTMVSGINHALEKKARIAWSSPEAAEAEIVKLADSLDGPEILPEGGLARDSAVKIANELIKAAQARLNAGERVNAEHTAKTASSHDLGTLAVEAAAEYMRKIASEPLIIAGGEHPNTLSEAAQHDDVTRLDLHNRPEGAYKVPQGKTMMPMGGVVGEELAHPKAPPTSPALNSTVSKKVAEDMQAGLEALPAKMKLAAYATLAGDGAGRSDLVVKLAAAGRARRSKLANDPAALMSMLEGGGAGGAPPGAEMGAPPPEAMGGHPGAGGISPEVAQLIIQLLSGEAGGGAPGGMPPEAAGPPAGLPEGKPEHKEPDGDEMPEKGASDKSILDFLDKVAAGGSLTDSEPNTLTSAAKTDNVSKLDKHNRAEGAYEVAQGKTEMPNAGHVGAKKDTPPANTSHADTVPTREATKMASAEDVAYAEQFAKVARENLSKLPASMPQAEKIAMLRKLTGPTPSERAEILAAAAR